MIIMDKDKSDILKVTPGTVAFSLPQRKWATLSLNQVNEDQDSVTRNSWIRNPVTRCCYKEPTILQ